MPSTNSSVGLGGLAFLDGDDAVLADLLEGVGHQLADGRVVVGADAGDLRHLFLLGQPLGDACRRSLDGRVDGLVDAALDGHRVGAGGDVAQAFLVDGAGPGWWPWWCRRRRRRWSSEATALTSLAPMFSNGSGRSISLRDGDAVLGDGRAAEAICRG